MKKGHYKEKHEGKKEEMRDKRWEILHDIQDIIK